MNIPKRILPALAKATKAHSLPLEFWESANGDRIMACFSTLAAELSLSGQDLGSLPAGYRLATVLFNWENECQREGWNAFAWTPDVNSVAQAYVEVGLGDEGAAISRAAAACRIDKDDLDGINAAYDDGPNVRTIDHDRFEYLVDYLCEEG